MPNIARFFDVSELRLGDKVKLVEMDDCDIFSPHDRAVYNDAANMLKRAEKPDAFYVAHIECGFSDSTTGVCVCVGEPVDGKEISFTIRPDFLAPSGGEFYEGRHVKQHKVADVSDRLLWQTLQALNAVLDSEDIHADLSAIIKRIDDHFKS